MKLSRQDVRFILLWAGIWTASLSVAFLIPLDIHSQTVNCNSVVTADEAGVIKNSSEIEQAAGKLIDQGVDPHVITVTSIGKYGTSLNGVMAHYTENCSSWMTGSRFKANLLVLVVAPKERKKNAFFGSAISAALESPDQVNYIYSQAANPYFKSGDFAGGLAMAERDFGAKIAAYHDQVKHPVQKQTVVNNQATDLSGFWKVLGWLLAAVVVGFIIFFTVKLLRRRKEDSDAIDAAKGDAIDARNRATDAYDALSEAGQSSFAKHFANLSNTVANDPTVDGLSVADYRRIERAWDGFYDLATSDVRPVSSSASAPATPVTESDEYPPQRYSGNVTHTNVTHTTIVNNPSNNDGLLTGMIIGEELNQPRERDVYVDRTPTYRERDPEPEPPSSGSDSSWSSSSDDDSSSGSDSSFSSDSGSSDFSSGDDSSF